MNNFEEKKLLKIVQDNYEEIAADFSKTRENLFWPELENFIAEIKDKAKILDVGCGNGRLLNYFKNKNINYFGVDNSKNLLALAINKYGLKTNTKFKLSNILDLNFKENNFDFLFCIAVLHHLPGEKLRIKALKNLKDKLNDNGEIFLTVWNLWANKKYKKLLFYNIWLKIIGKNKFDFGDIVFNWKNKSSQRYYHAFTSRELKNIIKKSGLKIKKFKKDEKNYYLTLIK